VTGLEVKALEPQNPGSLEPFFLKIKLRINWLRVLI
jgi:hypothetical protein